MAAPRLSDWNSMESAPTDGRFVELLLQDNHNKQLFGCADLHRWDGYKWRTRDGIDIHPSIKPVGWLPPKVVKTPPKD